MKKQTILITSALIVSGSLGHAALSAIANGDAESGVVYDLGPDLTEDSSIGSGSDWFEGSVGSYGEVIANASHSAYSTAFQAGLGNIIVFNNSGGYIYQNLGKLGSETSATVSFDAHERVQGNGNFTIDVAFFASTTFVGSNGTDIQGAGGVTALGTGSYAFTSDANLATNEDVTGASIANVSLAGASTGDDIWIRMSTPRPAGDSTANIDNVSIAYVPEPSSISLLGLGGLALILRRRK